MGFSSSDCFGIAKPVDHQRAERRVICWITKAGLQTIQNHSNQNPFDGTIKRGTA